MRFTSLAKAAIAGSAALALTACGGSGTSQVADDGEGVSLTVTTTIGGPDNYHNVPIDAFFSAVEEASDGRVSFDFSYANAIVPPAEVGSAMADGTVDSGLVVTSYNPSEFPVSNWASKLAFAGESGPPAAALDRPAAVMDWWFSQPEAMQSDFNDQGLMPLTPGFNAHTAYHLICTEPVTSLEEAQGKSVRSPGEAWAETATAIGMEPVSLPGAEMYESLQRGIVDCVMADATDMVSSDLTEVAKHYTTVNLPGFTAYGIFMSQQTWDSLDPELQTIVWEQIPVYLESLAHEGLLLQEELLETSGMEFHTMEDDLADAVGDHQQSVLDGAADAAPDAVADPQAAVDQFVDLHDKWGSIVTDELGIEPHDSWAEWNESGGSTDDIDAAKYTQRVYDEVLADSIPQ